MVCTIASILEYCLRKSAVLSPRPTLRARAPQLEPLESRVLLSAITLADPVYVATGTQLRRWKGFEVGSGAANCLLRGNLAF